MSVGTFSLEQEKDLEKHCKPCSKVLATLVSNKITMQHEGGFGTKLATKTNKAWELFK
jgi:hypothetical protein